MSTSVNLPNSLTECHRLIQELCLRVEDLSAKLRLSIHQQFGQKTEQFKYIEEELDRKIKSFKESNGQIQLELFDNLLQDYQKFQDEVNQAKKEEESAEPISEEKTRKRKTKGKIARLDELSHLQVQECHHGDQIKDCPKCSSANLEEMGTEICDQLEIIPAQIIKKRNITHKYKCKECGELIRGEKPIQPIEKCLAGPDLLTHICHQRFSLYLPYYRLHRDFLSYGVDISEVNMCHWMIQLGQDVFKPLYDVLKEDVLSPKIMYCDETTFKELAKGKCLIKYIWGYTNIENKNIVYDYSTRSRENPSKFLKNYKDAYLVTDKYSGYNEVCRLNNIIRCYCWLHGRRKFTDMIKSTDDDDDFPLLKNIVVRIDEILGLDKKIRKDNEDAKEKIVKLRHEIVGPKIDDFFEFIGKIRSKLKLTNKNKFVSAIDYFLRSKEEFKNFLQDGRLEPTNNLSERNLRFFTIGRKNFMFAGSARGGRIAAIIFSIVASARAHNLDVRKYLNHIIRNLPKAKMSEIKNFLPQNCYQFKALPG